MNYNQMIKCESNRNDTQKLNETMFYHTQFLKERNAAVEKSLPSFHFTPNFMQDSAAAAEVRGQKNREAISSSQNADFNNFMYTNYLSMYPTHSQYHHHDGAKESSPHYQSYPSMNGNYQQYYNMLYPPNYSHNAHSMENSHHHQHQHQPSYASYAPRNNGFSFPNQHYYPAAHNMDVASPTFSSEEDLALLQLVDKFDSKNGKIDWEQVAFLHPTNLAVSDCILRWQYLQQHPFPWSEDEDMLLLQHVRNIQEIDWHDIADYMNQNFVHKFRTSDECYQRWTFLQSNMSYKAQVPSSMPPDSPYQYGKNFKSRYNHEMDDGDYNGAQKRKAIRISESVEYESVKKATNDQWSDADDEKLLTIVNDMQPRQKKFDDSQCADDGSEDEMGGSEDINLACLDWNKISSRMGRSIQSCKNRLNTLTPRCDGAKQGSWSAEEDVLLLEAIRDIQNNVATGTSFNNITGPASTLWREVASKVRNRSAVQCRNRWKHSLQPKITGTKCGGWSPAEDQRLIEAIENFGGKGRGGGIDWAKVAAHVVGRTPKHCVNRWNNHLKQRVVGRGWTDEEDANLEKAVLIFLEEEANKNMTCNCASCKAAGKMVVSTSSNGHVIAYHEGKGGNGSTEKVYTRLSTRNVPWEKIAVALGTNRTPEQCKQRYKYNMLMMQKQNERGNVLLSAMKSTSDMNADGEEGRLVNEWSTVEDEKLLEAVSIFKGSGSRGSIDWDKVSEYLGEEFPRAPIQCKIRWNAIWTPKIAWMKSGPWCPEEDARLIEAVGSNIGQGRGGSIDWGKVTEYLGGRRTYKQCFNRWKNVLQHRVNLQGDELTEKSSSHRVPKVDANKIIINNQQKTNNSGMMNDSYPSLEMLSSVAWDDHQKKVNLPSEVKNGIPVYGSTSGSRSNSMSEGCKYDLTSEDETTSLDPNNSSPMMLSADIKLTPTLLSQQLTINKSLVAAVMTTSTNGSNIGNKYASTKPPVVKPKPSQTSNKTPQSQSKPQSKPQDSNKKKSAVVPIIYGSSIKASTKSFKPTSSSSHSLTMSSNRPQQFIPPPPLASTMQQKHLQQLSSLPSIQALSQGLGDSFQSTLPPQLANMTPVSNVVTSPVVISVSSSASNSCGSSKAQCPLDENELNALLESPRFKMNYSYKASQ